MPMPMPITITAFAHSPDGGAGLARDMPVRWALEETGQAYEVRFVGLEALKQPEHRSRQPFGQIPTYEEGCLCLFESGAIVLHIAERRPGLLPAEPVARARATAWMFAALDTIEPPVVELETADLLEKDKPWHPQRRPMLQDRVRTRLGDLRRRLGSADWLDGDFSAGDLLMVSILRRLAGKGLLEEFPSLVAYRDRAEARPAYRRAFAAQRADFLASSGESKRKNEQGANL